MARHEKSGDGEVIRSCRDCLLKFFSDLRGLLICAGLVILGMFLEHVWVVKYPGMLMMQAIDAARDPKIAKHTVLVTITQDEYEDKRRFGNRSPLDEGLLSVAIDKILKLDPRVLAVDLDTADAKFGTKFRNKYINNQKLIWARSIVPSGDEFHPGGFLGKSSEESDLAGIAGFERDPDWTVRKVNACVELDGQVMQTFHRAIFRAFDRGSSPRCTQNTNDDLGIPYFPVFTLSEAERAANALRPGAPHIFKDKVVILGGTYSYADYHPSRAGMIIGVKLVGAAVEAQLASEKPALVHWTQKTLGVAFEFRLVGRICG